MKCYFRIITFNCVTLLCGSTVIVCSKPIIEGFESLPLEWNLQIQSPVAYWLSYFHEILVVTVIGCITGSYDSLVASCMLQICAQMELLQIRLGEIQSLGDEEQLQLITRCLRHHDQIYRYRVWIFLSSHDDTLWKVYYSSL